MQVGSEVLEEQQTKRQKLIFESFSERVLEALPAAEGYSARWRGRFGGSSSRRGAFDERLV